MRQYYYARLPYQELRKGVPPHVTLGRITHVIVLSDGRGDSRGVWGTAVWDLSGNGNRVYDKYFSKTTSHYNRGWITQKLVEL